MVSEGRVLSLFGKNFDAERRWRGVESGKGGIRGRDLGCRDWRRKWGGDHDVALVENGNPERKILWQLTTIGNPSSLKEVGRLNIAVYL